MSTNANIIIGTKAYHINGDGYPDTVKPFLKSIVSDAKGFIKRNKDFTFIDACQYLIEQEITEYDSWVCRNFNDYHDYTYEIEKTGRIIQRQR